ncbi:uncharacterized protein LOC130691167 [Daphnia carinata]|uniref:uncharacterized protein LOC130691167 n=1 Tax=Daphnia carinata TaxID=120202 RepID=UPI002580E7C0|nr:uncharacterized protein LOC130691167 [Daphnia carinata]
MPISYFSLLLVLSAAWMGHGLPAEPKEPTSRDSRQMMFPFGVVPMQQPSDFIDVGTLVHHLPPAAKLRLVDALLTTTAALSENPPLSPGYKAGTGPNSLDLSNLDPNASPEELFQRISHLVPYSLEELRDMQSRLGLDAVVTLIVQALVGQIVSVLIVPFIISIIAGMFAG